MARRDRNTAEWAGPTAGANTARLDVGPFAGPAAGGLQQTIYYSLSLNITDVAVLNPSTSVAGYIIGGFNTITGPQTGSVGVIGTRLLARVHPNDATKYQIGMAKNSNDVVWDSASTASTSRSSSSAVTRCAMAARQ